MGWSAGSRSRSSRPGSAKLQPTISYRPRPTSRPPRARRTRWAWLSTPGGARRAGSVAGSRSTPSMRATSSIRSTSRVTSLRRSAGTVTSSPSVAGCRLEVQRPRISRLALARRPPRRGSRARARSRRRIGAAAAGSPPTSIVPGATRRAAQLDHQLRRDRLGVHALLGLQPLLEARRGLAAQPQRPRAAVDVGAVPGGDLEQHPASCPAGPPSARRPSARRSRSGPRRPRSGPSRRRACASARRASAPARPRARGAPSAARPPRGRGRRRAAAGR